MGQALFGRAARYDDIENFHQLVGGDESGPVADDISAFGEEP
jgi:hypothetical protein